jgi:hypothetical protein
VLRRLGVTGFPGKPGAVGCSGGVGVASFLEEEGQAGPPRFKRCSPNGVAKAGAALRNSRAEVMTVGSMFNDRA